MFRQEKLERKRQQEANVERKRLKLEAHKESCLKGMPEDKKRKQLDDEDNDDYVDNPDPFDKDEAEYYCEAVGELPPGKHERGINTRLIICPKLFLDCI